MKLGAKSIFNSDAASLLIKNNLYAPSVHCSYYACFQSLKRVNNYFLRITYDDIDDYIAVNKTNEHSYVKRNVFDVIHKCDSHNYRDLKNKLNDLFQFRINSDYKDYEVLCEEAEKAQKYSVELIKYMKEKFHI